MASAKLSDSTRARTARQQGIERIVELARQKVPLSHRDFAEAYITMPPSGPRGGERFRVDWQPFVGLLFDELDSGNWHTAVITGTVQSSKTFSGLVVPTLRDVVELGIGPIVAVPEADMFADKWDQDFKPVLDASPDLLRFVPTSGPGLKGGRVKDRITLGNNVSIKVMTRGGQATNKAGYTSSRLRVTEAAGFSEASTSEKDQEADSFRQLLGRLGAFELNDPRRFVSIEGTVTVAEQLPWRLRGDDEDEILVSSRSRIVSPCPHCQAWISPEREHLVGWQNAESEQQVFDQTVFVCPACGQGIDDAGRAVSMRDCRLLHWGQEIKPDGTIVGAASPSKTLWFRFSTFQNLLKGAANTAIIEWQSSQIEDGTLDRENAERDLCQKYWAIPFNSSLADNEPLNPQTVRKRRDEWPRNVLPPDTRFVTVGVDLGKYTGWWLVIAFRENGQLYIAAYGAFDVCRGPQDDIATRIVQAIREHREGVILPGFYVEGREEEQVVGAVAYDLGWMPDDVGAAVREGGSGLRGRFFGARGRGKSISGNNGGYNHPKVVSVQKPRMGMQWYCEWNHKRRIVEITFNADFWKLYVQERLRVKPGRKGALTFYRADTKNEHAKLSNHLCSDQLVKEWDAKRGGLVEKWTQTGDNHWGDCAAMAAMLGNWLGFSLRDIDDVPEESYEPEPAEDFYARMLA